MEKENILSQLKLLEQGVAEMGNDSGETSKIIHIIDDFQKGTISGKEALEKANKIVYAKQDGIDATSGGH